MSLAPNINIAHAEEFHQQAMDLAEAAFLSKLRSGQREDRLLRQAYELERRAAEMVAPDLTFEPSRSVLLRSAATLALDCGDTRAAERHICTALSGNPPEEIAEELRDLLEEVHFQRHLQLRGIALTEGQVQLSMAGNAVSFGTIPSREFVTRVQSTAKLFLRTGERKRGEAYREAGPTTTSIKEAYSLYMSVPRAASFAVTLRLGGPQMTLPGLEQPSSGDVIIDEVFECLNLLNRSAEKELAERIGNSAYYRNFVSLADQIAPDGKNISVVGFTARRHGKETSISLNKPSDISSLIRQTLPSQDVAPSGSGKQVVTISGELRFANSLNPSVNQIVLIEDNGTKHRVTVPEGLMNDVVKPYWDEKVTIKGLKVGRNILLEEIAPHSDS